MGIWRNVGQGWVLLTDDPKELEEWARQRAALLEEVEMETADRPANSDSRTLAAGLAYLAAAQWPFLQTLGHDNDDPDTLARYGAALMIEVAEFVNEVPWKVWRRRAVEDDPDMTDLRAAILDEWADVLHFIGTWEALLRHFDITPADAAAAFVKKNEENLRRRQALLREQEAAGGV